MVQQKGETCKRWSHLNGLTPSKYFSQEILLPMGWKFFEERPNINTTLPKLMRMSLKKMKESLKNGKRVKKNVKPNEKKKCVTCPTNCVSNSVAKPSRQCETCANYEHNNCYDSEGPKGTLIQLGQMEFNCTADKDDNIFDMTRSLVGNIMEMSVIEADKEKEKSTSQCVTCNERFSTL